MNVVGNWRVWVGTIGKAEVNIACNECDDESDCNLNGQCIQGKCSCDRVDGVRFVCVTKWFYHHCFGKLIEAHPCLEYVFFSGTASWNSL